MGGECSIPQSQIESSKSLWRFLEPRHLGFLTFEDFFFQFSALTEHTSGCDSLLGLVGFFSPCLV